MRTPTLPLVSLSVAGVALAFTLSGSAVALPGKNKVDGGDIKNSSVTGKDIKADSLTGSDIKESTLGTVPSAASLSVAKSGSTQSGVFSGGGGDSTSGYFGSIAQYTQPLAEQIPDGNIIDTFDDPDPALCPGPGSAAPGYLCLYFDLHNQIGTGYGYSTDSDYPTPSVGASLYFEILGSNSYANGSWTVTAP